MFGITIRRTRVSWDAEHVAKPTKVQQPIEGDGVQDGLTVSAQVEVVRAKPTQREQQEICD